MLDSKYELKSNDYLVVDIYKKKSYCRLNLKSKVNKLNV